MNMVAKLTLLCHSYNFLMLSLNNFPLDFFSCGQQLTPGELPNCFGSFLNPLNEG